MVKFSVRDWPSPARIVEEDFVSGNQIRISRSQMFRRTFFERGAYVRKTRNWTPYYFHFVLIIFITIVRNINITPVAERDKETKGSKAELD